MAGYPGGMDDYWAAVLWSLLPTVVVSALFFFILRSVIRADRNERREYARIEAEERAKRGLPPAGRRRRPPHPSTDPTPTTLGTPPAGLREGGDAVITLTFDASWWLVLVFVFDLIVRVLAIIFVPRNRRPTAAMAWLLAIYFIPLIGVFLFLLIGNPRLPRKRRRKQERINAVHPRHERAPRLRHAAAARPGVVHVDGHPQPQPRRDAARRRQRGAPHPRVSEEPRRPWRTPSARRSGTCTSSSTSSKRMPSTDNLFRALEEACARGVTVRVLLDHWANRGKPFYRKTLKRLDAMGAQWHLMLPVQPLRGRYQRPDLRNHRKLLVVDGTVAFMGSQNVTDSTYNLRKNIKRGLHWVDLMVRLEGPVVASVNAVFLSDWYSETDEVLPEEVDLFDVRSGPGRPRLPDRAVRPRIRVREQPAAVPRAHQLRAAPDHRRQPLLRARRGACCSPITTACHRGLQVELFVSEEGDQAIVYHAQRSYYEVLLRAGVKIWMYRTPVHPALQVDDDRRRGRDHRLEQHGHAIVRSQHGDLDARARRGVRRARCAVVEDMYRGLSRELTLEEWEKQPLRSTVLDNLARLTSALQ